MKKKNVYTDLLKTVREIQENGYSSDYIITLCDRLGMSWLGATDEKTTLLQLCHCILHHEPFASETVPFQIDLLKSVLERLEQLEKGKR